MPRGEVDVLSCAFCTGSSFEGRIDVKRSVIFGLSAAVMLALVGSAMVSADSNRQDMKARLSGFQEVPAISTQGSGSLRLKVNDAGTSIAFELSYANLEGGAASAAHIHFAQPGVNGAPIAWLCGGGREAGVSGGAGEGHRDHRRGRHRRCLGPGDRGRPARRGPPRHARGSDLRQRSHPPFPAGEIRGLIGGKKDH